MKLLASLFLLSQALFATCEELPENVNFLHAVAFNGYVFKTELLSDMQYLRKQGHRIIDIQYSTCTVSERICFSALVIYEEVERMD